MFDAWWPADLHVIGNGVVADQGAGGSYGRADLTQAVTGHKPWQHIYRPLTSIWGR